VLIGVLVAPCTEYKMLLPGPFVWPWPLLP
jgi:hypothetical protein